MARSAGALVLILKNAIWPIKEYKFIKHIETFFFADLTIRTYYTENKMFFKTIRIKFESAPPGGGKFKKW